MTSRGFPEEFVWGAATAAYQIEGGVAEGGRGESIWDRFSHTPGNTLNGDTGDLACDHFHLWQSDVRLMQELNLSAYRFSVAWPRVMPEGWGRINQAGLDFYDNLVDELLAHDIEPWVTLYHWDLPVRVDDSGGWPHRSTTDAFAEYADVVSRRLGDRVKHWMTINEPWVVSLVGYLWGRHAPGHWDLGEALSAAHHLLLAHGKAVPVIRQNCPDAEVGIVLNPTTVRPGSDRDEDLEAAVREDGLHNRWWLDPLSGRGYPQDMVDLFGDAIPEIQQGDMETIAAEADLLGVNYYSPAYVGNDPDSHPIQVRPQEPQDVNRTAMNWIVEPQAFVDLLKRVDDDYAFPKLYITENGAAYTDTAPEDGRVLDPKRTNYLHDHIGAVLDARNDGVPVEGYFCWSLMDNFEWAEGYSKRFGIVHVDFETQKRTIKDSGRWYARVIETGELLDPDI